MQKGEQTSPIINFIMKCSVVILMVQLTFTGAIWAASAKGQNIDQIKVDLKFQQASLQQSLLTLQKKSGVQISFADALMGKETKKITLDARQISVREAIKKILGNTNLTYRLEQDYIVIDAKPIPKKPGRISGKILDDKGEALPGASIRVVETGAGAQSGVDGSYILNVQPGTYTLEISYMSFQTQRITGVVVKEDKNTPLEISMKPDTKGLQEVVVTASYRKASTEGLLARQKNASEISNGISAEQIARTPDKNIGESLKRISGLNTIDNKYVIVRGIGERYNSAMLDGVVLPSTEAVSRNFSFDLIPSNMVDNVVVSKTVTPDMNVSFGGGLVQINTKDIPTEDFMSFSAGLSYNDQATGKDFISHKRGKYDYLGFDDGGRALPKDFVATSSGLTPEQIAEQSKMFTNDNFTVYRNTAAPSQNYQFTIGRLLTIDTSGNNRLGFTGSLSYRNTQSNNAISQMTRGDWDQTATNTGNAYGFNTTLGGLLNVGLQLGKNRFSFRNTYTHLFDNTLYRFIGHSFDSPRPANGEPGRILESDDPTFTNLLQNKLSGQHQLGNIKLEWNAARTSVNRKEKDLIIAESVTRLIGSEYIFYTAPTFNTEPVAQPLSRHHYQNNEAHYSWDLASTIPFNIGKVRSTVKVGYFGNQKKGGFDWMINAFTRSRLVENGDELTYLPIGEMLKPENMGADKFQYTTNSADAFEGKSRNHAGFIMFDNRLMEKLRLVWGIRGDYYKYTEVNNPTNTKLTGFVLKPDRTWQWLPSTNLTYSPIASLNIRGAYSSSVVRPELRDNSQFFRFNPYLGGLMGNKGLYSTRIDSWDFKTEWFPGLGEILSAGAFYKKFDKPTELELVPAGNTDQYWLKSADWAKVYGLEFEIRKSFGFIADHAILNNLTAYGNLTLQKSEVLSNYLISNPDPAGPDLNVTSKESRALYGQAPYLINAGLQYIGDRLGLNVMYNRSGYKTYLVSSLRSLIEYERPREQVDAQISYRFLKKRMEIKVNASNLLNSASTFYRNSESYDKNPDNVIDSDGSDAELLKQGFTDKYEDGDRILFSQKFGRTYSTTLTWNF